MTFWADESGGWACPPQGTARQGNAGTGRRVDTGRVGIVQEDIVRVEILAWVLRLQRKGYRYS